MIMQFKKTASSEERAKLMDDLKAKGTWIILLLAVPCPLLSHFGPHGPPAKLEPPILHK